MSARTALAHTHYASVLAMAEWFAAARAGEEMAYAAGPALDPREAAAQLAARWVRDGAALTFQRRELGALRYFVRKRSGEASAPSAPQPQSLDPESIDGRIYALLRRCANLSQPCPSHEDIAERLNLSDRSAAANRTRALVARGLIRVDWPARSGPRIVTIVATGKQTAGFSSERSR